MEKEILLSSLFDYYGCLLTEKQQMYFKDYYFDNLTLSEMSENYNISRNAIHKSIKEVEDKLLYYEEKLNLYDKSLKIKDVIGNISNDIKEKINELI